MVAMLIETVVLNDRRQRKKFRPKQKCRVEMEDKKVKKQVKITWEVVFYYEIMPKRDKCGHFYI